MSDTVRALREEDRDAVREIFNHYVLTSTAAYTETPLDLESVDALIAEALEGGALVAEDEDLSVVGFALLRSYSPLSTFSRTAVVTYFIAAGHTRRGIGSRLLLGLFDAARSRGVEMILAHIAGDNEASLAFHRRHGFVECGRFRGVWAKHGALRDLVWMQRKLGDGMLGEGGG